MVDRVGESSIQDLLRRVVHDGARWFDAEVALARAQAGSTLSGYVTGAMLAAAGLFVFFAALVALTQAAIVALAPVFQSLAVAALVVASILAIVSAALGWIGWRMLKSAGHRLPIVERLGR